MIAAAEAMMSTMPPAAGELKNADGTSDILFLFLSGISDGTVAKLAMRQPFVLFKGLTFQKLCLP
ncbi:hypothetical protein, partial [Klebsiella pneumoniae]|uniref:hypothetical protein n=1 Tax=Klebsiella pneumoniae TaxID=573 RepID=UPI0026EB5AE6